MATRNDRERTQFNLGNKVEDTRDIFGAITLDSFGIGSDAYKIILRHDYITPMSVSVEKSAWDIGVLLASQSLKSGISLCR